MTASMDWWGMHAPVAAAGAGRRVLHVVTRLSMGGAANNLGHFIRWESAAGFEVELAIGPESNLDPPADIRCHIVPNLRRSVRPSDDIRATVQIRALCAKRGYDVVHTHLSKAGIVGRLAARGHARRIAHTVHMSSFGPGYGRLASATYLRAERRMARSTDLTVFVGEELAKQYTDAQVAARDSSLVIRSPIDVEPLLESREWPAQKRAAIRKGFGIGPTSSLVVAMGLLEPRKRHDVLVRQIAPILDRDDIELVIAGHGPQRDAIRNLADALHVGGRVHLPGHIDDVTPLLAAADAFVHCSGAEGVPQVVIQALAAGLPVAATDVIGLREIQGAPVHVASASGHDLADKVSSALSDRGTPVPPPAFTPWRCAAIDPAIQRFHARLAA